MSRSTQRPPERSGLAEQLEPVHEALLEEASADAERLREGARADADHTVAQAAQAADAQVEEMERRSAIALRAHADQERSRARAEAHTRVLTAREEIHQALRASVRQAVRQLRDDPRYPALLDHYEARARAQLGPRTRIERDPDPMGGVVATAGRRRLDYSLDALADLAFDALADEAAGLWQ